MAPPLDQLIDAFHCSFFPVQVLVVDDDVTSRAAMRRVLEHQGYTVIVAENADAALRLLERTHVPVDLLVTDVQMPGMTGDALATHVRQAWPELPVLFVSGDPRNAVLAGAVGGASRFLAKPFLPTELLEAVAAVLEPAVEQAPLLDQPVAELGF